MADSDVSQSYGRCCVNPKFFDRFYDIFLKSHPAIAPMFQNTNFGKQKALLRSGLSMMLMHTDGKPFGTQAMDRIGESHGKKKMNIDPSLYQYWIDSLVTAVKECDPEFNQALEASWRKVLRNGVDYIVAGGTKVAGAA